MRHFRLFRAMLGGAGLAGCVGLLAGQARADIVEFVPVRPANPPVTVNAKVPPVAPTLPAMVALSVKAAPGSADSRLAGCEGERVAMAPVPVRQPD